MYSKLFASITDSTIWREEDHTRIVWITLLAMCDKHGEVAASVPGLADRARVPLGATIKALEVLASPDEWSRSQEHEGRRIETIGGGWKLLNYDKYRRIRDEEERKTYMRNYMRKRRSKQDVNNVSNVSPSKPPLANVLAHTDAYTDIKPNPPISPPPSRGNGILTIRDRRRLNDEIWRLMDAHPEMPMEEAMETACAGLMLPIGSARAAVSEAGMKDALKGKKR